MAAPISKTSLKGLDTFKSMKDAIKFVVKNLEAQHAATVAKLNGKRVR